MFVNNFFKRILSSLLRPWLEHDLELDLHLGFINSIAISKNIRLDTSALNRQIIDGSSSPCFFFKEFVIGELVVRFSVWSDSAFSVEARGVNVTLSLEEMGEECTAKVRNSSTAVLESLKNDLSLIDPEGSALHDILAATLATACGRNRFQSSFLNLILQHCRLQILGINLQIQFPTLDDSFVYLLNLEKLNAESLHFVHGCLCRGLVNVLFLPLKEGSFVVSGDSFKIIYKKSNQISRVCSSSALVTCIKLNDLELVEFNLRVPELSFSFSPVDFPIFMELSNVPSKEFKRVRNGRYLWRLAAIKIGHVISAPKLSWYKLVDFTILWLRYVNHYEYLLSLVRYSPDHLSERPDIKIPRDKVILTSAKHYWAVIFKIEKELPAEAIAQARRIARYKALSSGQQSEDNYAELFVNARFKTFVQKVMQIILPMRHLLFWRTSANQDDKFVGNPGNVSESSYSRFRFILSLGKIYITLSSMSAAQIANEDVKSDIGISYSDVFSFRFSIKVFLLMYIEDIFKQSLSFSCGKVKVKYFISSVGEEKERIKNLKIILQGEPAKIFPFSESNKTSTINHAEGGCDSCLENFIGKMCLDWKQACKQFEESEIRCPQSPRLLFEMKSFLRHPDLEKLGSGLWKCNLTVGKLNIALGYLSMISVLMLVRQIQHALHWTRGNGCGRDFSYSPRNTVHHQEDSWEKKYEGYSSKIKMSFMKMLPGKDIQIGVLMAGPRIQFSTKKIGTRNVNEGVNNHIVSGGDFHLGFDIHDIEVVVWPSSKSGLAPIHDFIVQDDEYPECLRLQEPKILDIPKLENNKYRSKDANSLHFCLKFNGLQAYLEDIVDRHKNQIFVLDPITFQISSFRQCAHSFSTTSIAFSTVFYGLAMGFTLLLFMDDLSACIQALTDLYSDLSHLCNNFGSPGNESFQILRHGMVSGVYEDEELPNATPLICNNTLFLINGIFKLKSMDIFLCSSRISNEARSSKMAIGAVSSTNSAANNLSDYGIWISLPRMCFDILYEEMKLELVIDLSGIQSVIIRYQENMRKRFTRSAVKEFLLCSHNCLYEVFSSHCIFTLLLSLPENLSSSTSVNEMRDVSTSEVNTSSAVSSTEQSPIVESSDFLQKLTFTSNIPVPASSHWIFINIVVDEVFVTRCSVKNILIDAQKINKLLSSLYVGAKSQTITWEIQGGFLCLEAKALAMFIQCTASYVHHIKNALSIVQSTARSMQKPAHDDHSFGGHSQEMLLTSQQVRQEHPKAFSFDVSQFSLALIVESESSHIQEFVLELDLVLNLDLDNMQRKFMFKLSRLSIFSQVFQQSGEEEIQILHSSTQSKLSSQPLSGESSVAFKHENGHFPDGDSYSRASASEGFICFRHQDYILKHLTACLSVEKAEVIPLDSEQVWVGSGSISGFDMKITLSELEVILSMVSSFSGLSVNGSTGESVQRNWSYNPQDENNFEARIPNGAIVAIQDVHQHLYFTVEGGENKYAIGGAVHYSFVGERALFRVKYHTQRKWSSSVFWFSLISLHAKDNSGEPLRLNSNPGSGFVELSSTSDNAWSLWRVIFYESTYEGDIDWEPYNHVLRNTFYLVNKKNDCAVAFNDRVPVFVKKPGNPFKFKVLSDVSVAQEVATHDMYFMNSFGTKIDLGAHEDGKRSYWQSGKLPCIGIGIDKVSLTIFHEFSDANDRFPLLHACIFDTQLNLQMLSTKSRVISTSKALLQYFDARANFWRDFLHPVEICIFYRSSFQNPHGVPVHVYCRTKELEISLNELSLDILLFMIGKLNLAGPFSLRNSMILGNCCKVENQTGLNLLCRFYGKQGVTVGRKQSVSLFLRLSAFVHQPPDPEPLVSVQLSLPGSFSTSPIHLSLLGAQALAWRTRILSLQDSKSYPGPFVVVDISRKAEDGLSIAVSPLIRIHNETKLSIELRIRRPEPMDDEFASVSLKAGDTFDDSLASFDAINLSGGARKALMSLNVGNFLFSFRPEMSNDLMQSGTSLSVEWSDEIKGGKAIRLSGIFDKLSYEVRKALSVGSVKCSFSTTYCTVKSAAAHVSDLHFLIQSIGREVPIIKPDKSKDGLDRNTPISLQEQKEIFILPTVRVSNLLHSEIHVLLNETNSCTSTGYDNIGKEATLPCRSTVDFYANPAIMYFFVSLTAFSSTSKPVNSSEWVQKLLKHKNGVRCLDIDLDFCGGKYFASLRLSRGYKGILEATVYTKYTLKNDTDFSLFFFPSGQKPSFRNEMGRIPPEFGLFLPPKSTGSWFLRSFKTHLKLFENPASEAQFDLDALSGPTEVSLEIEEISGVKYIAKFGVSIGPSLNRVVPSQIITIAPRHVVLNESDENITVRQCNLEVDIAGMISINSGQSAALLLQNEIGKRTEYSLFENFIKKHRNDFDSSLIYIQFQLNESQLDWSGPLCITSLGRFFLKFRKYSSQFTVEDRKIAEFAEVLVVEEGSTIVMRFHKPPKSKLPYRIENYLHGVSLTYYQKNSSEPEFLGSDCSVDYTWDDVTLPHKLVVILNDLNLPREINLDKVRTWKPFYKLAQERLASHMVFDKRSKGKRSRFGELHGMNEVRVGYEVYADGPTRVLRICEFPDTHKQDRAFHSCAKIRIRVSQFAIQLLEKAKEDLNHSGTLCYTPFAVARLQNISLDSLVTELEKYNQIVVQSLTIDVKWTGAPVASMFRRHRLDDSDADDSILKIVVVLLAAGSDVKQVKYSSVILQPIDLNIDEDTLMKIVSFWRTSLSDSNSSQQFYFDNFEIHPIKIIATFIPGESYSSYNSAQEALRTLIHSVVKVPPIKKVVVELNGVSVTHALVTIRELLIRCAQHYSWYAMRSISIAKGSELLPPGFASIFDDLASSSLDIFFDPSQGLMNLPGFKSGTFKFISKCINGKGFSGTKRYFGDLGKTLKTAGSNVIFAAVTEISDSVLKGAEASGFNGMVSGFHQGILKLAMEPSVLGTALMGGGPDRKIKLDRSPGVDELYIEGYLQAMLDSMYRLEYLRVRVIDDQVFLKNLPPNSSLINEIMDRVKGFLVSKALLKGDPSAASRSFHNFPWETEWSFGSTIITLCEHLFVSFAIRKLRSEADKYIAIIKPKKEPENDDKKAVVPADTGEVQRVRFIWKWGIVKFVLSGILAYVDGRLCRSIPNPIARRIVSGFLLSFLDQNNGR